MNCLIVDDDNISTSILERFAEKIEIIDKIDSCSGAIEAIQFLKKTKESIDLIFLDMEMPEMNGVEFLGTLKDQHPLIIVVSAKEKYAINAFDYDVTDYLLKPISFARMYKAVDKAHNILKNKHLEVYEGKDEFFIKQNGLYIKIKYIDIIWVEALENYIVLYTFRDKYTVHHTLKAVIDKLPKGKFFRVHRSYVVNLSRISAISSNDISVDTIEGSVSIPLGKAYRDKLLNAINVLSK